MKVKDILKAADGILVSGDPDTEIGPYGFSTDSRTLKKGDVFIAIKGRRRDGGDFLESAFKKGAAGAIVSGDKRRIAVRERIIIRVADTTKAYGAIARHHRMKFDIPVIAVTGSNGKTTTKEMIWHILSGKLNALKNEGTKNNHIGIPQALLQIKRGADVAVLEFGMNHKGEIRYLGDIARPSAGVITNIGPSHLESLGSLANVFKAKSELLECLPDKAAVILNGDDEFLSKIKMRRLKIMTFGFGSDSDFRATDIELDNAASRFLVNGSVEFELHMLGRHNILNAMAAIAEASNFGITLSFIRDRLSSFRETSGMRLAMEEIAGINFINDSYNANPLSWQAALEVISNYRTSGKKIVVSGDMLELGPSARSYHARIGALAVKSGIDLLLTVGSLSRQTVREAISRGMDEKNVKICATPKMAALILNRLVRPNDVVLVKGSRAMRMEKVIDNFKEIALA